MSIILGLINRSYLIALMDLLFLFVNFPEFLFIIYVNVYIVALYRKLQAANVVNSVKTRPRVLSLYRQIFRIARIWQANSGSVEDSSRQADYIKEEARTLFRQNAHITDEIEIEVRDVIFLNSHF